MTVSIIETFDDLLLADFYEQHWVELLGRNGDQPIPGWRDRFLDFTRRARSERAMHGYLAMVDGIACGSASCHLVEGTFPAFRYADTGAWGYVWGVYVLPERRGQRIGARLVSTCVEHLSRWGCQRVSLHAGDRSLPLYKRLGFVDTNELALTRRR